MQDGEDKGDENAIRRIEVLESQIHRFQAEVDRHILIAGDEVYTTAMESKVEDFAREQQKRDWHVVRKQRGHAEYLTKETEGCAYTAPESPRQRPDLPTDEEAAACPVASLLGVLGSVVKEREPSRPRSSRTVSVATSRDEMVSPAMRKPRGSKSSISKSPCSSTGKSKKSSSSSSSSSKCKSDDNEAPAAKKKKTQEHGLQSSGENDDGGAAALPPLPEQQVQGSAARPFAGFVAPSTRATTIEPLVEPTEARPTIQRPTTPVPPSEVLKFPSIFGGNGIPLFNDTVDGKRPAQPLQPPPELRAVYDKAPDYYPGRGTDLPIEGTTVEQVQESVRQGALENMASLVAAYNNHLLAPLKGGANSHPKFNTTYNNREIICYCEYLTLQMSFNNFEFCIENMPPNALRQERLDEWEDPNQWMEVDKHVDRRIFQTADFSKVGSESFRSWWHTEARSVQRELWISMEKGRQCDPAVQKAEKRIITEELEQRCKNLKGWVSSQNITEIYTEGMRVYNNLKRERQAENQMLQTALKQTQANLAKRVATISPHPPVLPALYGDPDVNAVTISSSLTQLGARFSPEHGPVVTKMVNWIASQTNKCASVDSLITQFSFHGERTEVWGELKEWLMLYDGVFKVSCGTSVTLAEETKAIIEEWTAVKQRQKDIAEGRAIEDPAPPPAPEPTYNVPRDGLGTYAEAWAFPIPKPQRFTCDKFDEKRGYKRSYARTTGMEDVKWQRIANTSILDGTTRFQTQSDLKGPTGRFHFKQVWQ